MWCQLHHNHKTTQVQGWGNMDTPLPSSGGCQSHCKTNIREPWSHYDKWYKPGTKEQILYDSTYIRHRDRSGMVVAMGKGRKNRDSSGYRVLVWEDEKFWRWLVLYQWLYNNMDILNATNCTLKNGQNSKFSVYFNFTKINHVGWEIVFHPYLENADCYAVLGMVVEWVCRCLYSILMSLSFDTMLYMLRLKILYAHR